MILRSWSLTTAKIMKSFKNPGTLNDSINMRSISAGSFMTSNKDNDRLCHTQTAQGFSSCSPGFNPRIIHVDLWWKKWKRRNFPPKSLILPHYWTFHQCSILIFHQVLVQYAHPNAAIPQCLTHPLIWWQLHYVHWYFYCISFLKLQGKTWKSICLTQLSLSQYQAAVIFFWPQNKALNYILKSSICIILHTTLKNKYLVLKYSKLI